MPKELYNEGRVVGYSVYEEYVKHTLSEDPNSKPASEREWLANSLGNGISMILKVEAHDTVGVHHVDYPLPTDSQLCAANTIMGDLFLGECECDSGGWATSVIDYGQGIRNTELEHPVDSNDSSKYPTGPMYSWITDNKYADIKFGENNKNSNYTYKEHQGFTEEIQANQLMQYLKIQDGFVLQPGKWPENEKDAPYADFSPNLQKVPVVRLVFSSKIADDFYILLTSFSNRTIISGISGLDATSTDSIRPENGDFLGPELYPWANKIEFSYPPAAEYYLRKGMYSKYNNLAINQNENSITTEFTSSYLKADKGITICGPEEPGGDILIGARIANDTNNYIAVTQEALNKEDCTLKGNIDDSEHQTNEHFVSHLQHGQIVVDRGIAIRLPQHPGEDIQISNKIQSTNNMVKIEQRRLPTINSISNVGTNNTNFNSNGVSTNVDSDTATKLTISEIHSNKTSGITVIQPTLAGGDVKISAPMSSTSSKWLKISSSGTDANNGSTQFKPLKISASNGIVVPNEPVESDNTLDLNLSIDTTKLKIKIGDSEVNQNLSDMLKSIVNKLNGTIGTNGITWNVPGTAAIGTINIYSGDDEKTTGYYIKTKVNSSDGDIKVK